MSGKKFCSDEQKVIYEVIKARRDIRRFRSDPISPEVIMRILEAATCAPSVGLMRPWNFILVTDQTLRKQVYRAFTEANSEALNLFSYASERQELYSKLKLEGILDSSLNVCITCDRNRAGPVVLGKTCWPEMDLYSTVCAVQNFWLAARVENIGVGWVSIIKPEILTTLFSLPENVVPIAYLCVGHTDDFPSEPELITKGWLPQIPMDEFLFENQWGHPLKL